jgi:predicted dehydrogenase
MPEHSRRTFFSFATAAVAASNTRLRGADDKVNVAVVGLGGRGQAHMTEYGKIPGARIVAVCDVDQSALEKGQAKVKRETGEEPKGYKDMRQVFDDKNVQAVSMPLPNHWHALATIWACQAGKDVYIEKPACHNPYEGQKMIEAARKYGRMVQIGSQSRSMTHKIKAMQLLHDGAIGKVYLAKGLCYKWRPTIGHRADEPTPPGLDWDKFLGPAPMRPYNFLRFHYNWHWFWDTGNGDIGNQGIHEMDIARWGLGVKFPHKVSAMGGHFMFDDDQETPNTMMAMFEFNEGGRKRVLEFEVRHWMSNHEAGIGEARPGGRKDSNTVGNVFYGSKGYLAIDGYNKYYTFLGRDQEPGPERTEGGNNWQNFIDVVRSRDVSKQNNHIDEGAASCVLMHLANISYRVGRTLEFDSEKMQIVGDKEANALLTRKYRTGFVVPEKV